MYVPSLDAPRPGRACLIERSVGGRASGYTARPCGGESGSVVVHVQARWSEDSTGERCGAGSPRHRDRLCALVCGVFNVGPCPSLADRP